MTAGANPIATTNDRLLGGRVIFAQPRDGFRAAIDPVLLAAAIPVRPGEMILEGGCASGAASLCVAARVPGITGLGIDLDSGLVSLARANAVANGWPNLWFIAADLAGCPVSGPVDHAFANPPYHAAGGTASPSSALEAAKRAKPGLLNVWVTNLARPLRHRGTLTLILPPWLLEEALAAMRQAHAPGETVFPVWPKTGKPARFLLVQGRKNGRSPLVVAPGLTLHRDDGTWQTAAEAILSEAGGLRLRP